MSHGRGAHRVAPVRPKLSSNKTVAHRPVNRPPPGVPMVLPILQPPIFPKQLDSINDNEKEHEHQNEIHNHPTTINNDSNRKKTQQNYPKQPVPNLSTRPI